MQGDFYPRLVFVQTRNVKESLDQGKERDVGLDEVQKAWKFSLSHKTLGLLHGQFLFSLLSFIPFVASEFERLPYPSCSFMPLHRSQLRQNWFEFVACSPSTNTMGAARHFREAGRSGSYPHQHLLEGEHALWSLWAATSMWHHTSVKLSI